MTKIPMISAIVPCYNQSTFLPVTLSSLKCQTLEDWECLIIDDGSPDGTATVAKSWSNIDKRFLYFRKENGGLSSARNYGLDRARGRYVQFLDSDDVILPDKFEIQIQQLLDSSPYSLSFCDYAVGSENNIYTPPEPSGFLLPPTLDKVTSIYEIAADWETRISIPAHCFLINRNFFTDGIRFDESLDNHEDWECWMRIFLKAEYIDYCYEKLAIYRQHSSSMCRDNEKMKNGFLKAIDKILLNPETSREIKAILRVKREETKLKYERLLQGTQKNSLLMNVLQRMIYKKIDKGKKIFITNR